jgi:hypothetical protein
VGPLTALVLREERLGIFSARDCEREIKGGREGGRESEREREREGAKESKRESEFRYLAAIHPSVASSLSPPPPPSPSLASPCTIIQNTQTHHQLKIQETKIQRMQRRCSREEEEVEGRTSRVEKESCRLYCVPPHFVCYLHD